jgi:hypothetical protein
MKFVVLFNVPYDAWEVMLVTNNLYKAIDEIKNTKANCIQIWENEKLINDYNFTEEWDYDSTYEYEKALSDDISRFIDNIKNRYINKDLITKLHIGIVVNPDLNIDESIEIFKNIVNLYINKDNFIINSNINNNSAKIETNEIIYELIKISDEFKGKRFDKNICSKCDDKIINKVLKPMLNYGLNNCIEIL